MVPILCIFSPRYIMKKGLFHQDLLGSMEPINVRWEHRDLISHVFIFQRNTHKISNVITSVLLPQYWYLRSCDMHNFMNFICGVIAFLQRFWLYICNYILLCLSIVVSQNNLAGEGLNCIAMSPNLSNHTPLLLRFRG